MDSQEQNQQQINFIEQTTLLNSMDEEKPKKRTRPNQQQSQQLKQQKPKKDLLRLQRDIFQLKKSQQHQSQYVIRKLMQKKQKPQISMVQQSPLLSRLKQMMPIFNRSNQQLQQRPIEESQKIDVRLQECESSSQSQSDSENENELEEINQQMQEISQTINETNQLKNKLNQMDIEKKMKKQQKKVSTQRPFGNSGMQEQQCHSNNDQTNSNLVQINFLTYPYLNQQQIDQLKSNNNNLSPNDAIQKHIEQLVQKKKQQKKILIQEISNNNDMTN